MIHSRPLSFSFVFSTVNSKCMLSVAIGDGWIQTRGPLGSTATTLPQPRLSKSPKTLVKYFIIDRSKISTFSERNTNNRSLSCCSTTSGLNDVAQDQQQEVSMTIHNNRPDHKQIFFFAVIYVLYPFALQ